MDHFCTFAAESWQSGRLRQSWKLLTVTGPGVRIPSSPLIYITIFNKSLQTQCFQGFFISSNLQIIQISTNKKGLNRDLLKTFFEVSSKFDQAFTILRFRGKNIWFFLIFWINHNKKKLRKWKMLWPIFSRKILNY